jgi:hypothetical protein
MLENMTCILSAISDSFAINEGVAQLTGIYDVVTLTA